MRIFKSPKGWLACQKDRILAQVKMGASDECWPWIGRKTIPHRCSPHLVYGRVVASYLDHSRWTYAHRAVWIILIGPIPMNFVLKHVCNNKLCCNPEHMKILSKSDLGKQCSGLLTVRRKYGTVAQGIEQPFSKR